MKIRDLEAENVSLSDLKAIHIDGSAVRIDRKCRARIEASAEQIDRAARGKPAIYGVNTGFGKLANVKISPEETAQLQRNLILSHCCGVGEPTPREIVRLMMVLKLISLGRGASGVRWQLIERIEALLEYDVTPHVPAQGSIGASGDLAPLAHMSAVLIGEGEATLGGETAPARAILEKVGLEPIELAAKEGLALINGSQFSTAHALAALFTTHRLAEAAIVTSALSTDAIMGSTQPLRPEIHELRGHRGQIELARAMRKLMEGSQIRESHREGDSRVQDPSCIRCQPQVTGACVDLLRQIGDTLRIEANAVTDNPIVTESGAILSGGNFHAEPVAFAADQMALAIAEIGAIAQRRVALMVDPVLSFDLPPFLTPAPGLNSGFMIAEVTTAALMSENKFLATPCATDSTPTSANQEDHVSMSAHGARRLHAMNANLAQILGIELLCAAQGIEFRAPLATSRALQKAVARLRRDVKSLREDRYMAGDLSLAAELVRNGQLVQAAGSAAKLDWSGASMTPVTVVRGDAPLVLAFPHSALWIPGDGEDRLNTEGRLRRDTDWHLGELYEGLIRGATQVHANFHRYYIDANRDPTGASLYPGQNVTALCPLTDFDNQPIYQAGQKPGSHEVDRRRLEWHEPYHNALAEELTRLRQSHDAVLLYDCHSIRSRIPHLFAGKLPDLNLGTHDGRSCAPELSKCVEKICQRAEGFSFVINGRFKGGWTIRHHANPDAGIHAIQMEIAQSTYLEAKSMPFALDRGKADRLRAVLAQLLAGLAHLLKSEREQGT